MSFFIYEIIRLLTIVTRMIKMTIFPPEDDMIIGVYFTLVPPPSCELTVGMRANHDIFVLDGFIFVQEDIVVVFGGPSLLHDKVLVFVEEILGERLAFVLRM